MLHADSLQGLIVFLIYFSFFCACIRVFLFLLTDAQIHLEKRGMSVQQKVTVSILLS